MASFVPVFGFENKLTPCWRCKFGLKTKAMNYKAPTVVATSGNNSVPWWELSWLSYPINIRNSFLKWTFVVAELLTTSLLFSEGFKSHEAATLALVNVCASVCCLPVYFFLYYVGIFLYFLSTNRANKPVLCSLLRDPYFPFHSQWLRCLVCSTPID